MMWTAIFAITTAICASKWLGYKIGNLTILLYYAEQWVKLPEKEDLEKYREKVIKKMLHVKEA